MSGLSSPVQKPRFALLASPCTRQLEGDARRFVEQHRKILSRSVHILTTGGVAHDLFADKSDLEVTSYPSHTQGGLIIIAADIVENRCDGLITFADPNREQSLLSPPNKMAFNQCLWHDRELIPNAHTANLWVTGQTGVVNQGEETLALIAHSRTENRRPKEDIIEFADEFAAEFSRFQRVICTGTTARELSEAVPQLSDKIFAFESGMKGGDVQIAREIVAGRCQHVVFFINPEWAQPHRDDVLTFIDISRHFGVNIMFTPKSAWRWAGQLRAE